MLEEAIHLAAISHKGQKRKGTSTPYIVHPLEVLAIASTLSNDEAVLCAAVLHDTIEDTSLKIETIQEKLGEDVARLVLSQSENKYENVPKDLSWKKRKEETIEHLKASDNIDEKILILSDKLSNMRSFYRDYATYKEDFWLRFNQKDKEMHKWYYESILSCLTELKDTYAYKELKELVKKVF